MSRLRIRRRRRLALFICGLATFQSILSPAAVWADGGGTVVAGNASIAQDGTTLNVTSLSDRTIINWQGFSIDAGHTANFLQPSANSAVLNRVVTPNNPSAIYGTLNSNGNVYLVNPSGIVVGASGVINTNGFTASVLDIPNHEFMQGGSLTFRGDSTASVLNQGTINTGAGGVALIGGNVINEGIITSDGGSISLASGGSVTLADGSRFSHADMATIESGISAYASVIRNSGTIRATGALEAGGEVYLVNPGGKVMQQGLIAAAKNTAATVDTAAANVGGKVVVTGDSVELAGATINASGDTAGGQINVGGGYQGGDPDIDNAMATTVDEHSVLRADAYVSGDGGQVIIWSDGETHFTGTASARGGTSGGDGGFVEVSGSNVFVAGSVDVGADQGTGGLFLLDPLNACLAFDASSCAPGEGFGDIDTIVATLNGGGSLLVTTAEGGSDAGNIRIVDSIETNISGTQTLTIRAHGGISLENGADIIDSGDGLNLRLLADFDGTGGDAITVGSGSTIDTNGGQLLFSGADLVTLGGSVASGGGDITFLADNYAIGDVVNAGTGTVLFDRVSVGNFGLGFGGGSGVATLNTTELGRISAADLVIGDPTAADNNIVQLDIQSTFDLSSTITGLVQLNALHQADSFISPTGAQTYRSVEMNSNDGITFIRDATTITTVGDAIFNVDADATGVSGGFDDFRAQGGVTSINSAAGIIVNTPQYTEVFGGTLNLDATGAITFQRSTSGTIGVGGGSGLTFSDAQLSRMNAAAIKFGNPITSNNTTAINVDDIDLSQIAGVSFNTTGTTSFAGASLFDSVSTSGGVTTVDSGATVDASGTIALNTMTVNLDGNLTATSGIAGSATTINIISSGSGAEIQDGIAVAGTAGATVNVADGTYAESVLLNKANVSLVGGSGAVIAPSSPAVTISAAGTTVDGFTYSGTSGSPAILVTSGADDVTITNGMITGTTGSGDGIQIDSTATAALTLAISNVTMTGVAQDGIGFDATLNGADIRISNSSIDGGRHGILFGGAITDSTTQINIANNMLIQGASQGIVFTNNVTDATVRIRGNGTDASNGIRGPFDAIAVNGGSLIGATFIVGGDTAADGNFIVSSNQALDIDAISGGRFVVANNDLIQGSAAIEFEQTIDNGAEIVVVNNGDFSSGGSGVDFRDAVDNAVVTISGNSFANTAGDAIRFGATTPSSLVNRITDVTVNIGSANNVTIDQTTVAVGGNVISGSANGSGINVEAMVQGDSEFVISGNTIGSSGNRVGQDGIRFAGGILDSSTVTLGGSNQVFASGQAIQVDDLQSPSTLAITDGTYDGNDGALLVDNTGVAGTDGRLNVGAAAFVGGNGSTVVEVLTDAGNAGVDIDFAGAATITGGATGLRLSGSGIDILGDWLGNLAFSSQTGDYITLANGAEFLPGSPTLIDAHSVSFDGMLGSDMTLPQLLAAEDRVTHYPDDKSLGLIDIASLFVVEGESIQTAVNAAGAMAGPQTVAVAAGTFGGSVELWVNNLSLVGSGATTIIDTNAVDAFANNGDVNNGFQVAAISGTSGGGDVSGVTIDGFAFDSLSSSGNNIGVELGATGLSDALGTTVQNSSFADLQHGVVARAIDGLTTISTISTNNIASHGVDFNAALDSGDTILVEDSSISGGDDGLRFSSSLTGSDITIRGNTIEGADDGLEFNDAIGGGSTVRIAGNSRVEGLGTASGEDNLGDGIAFRGVITGATTNILIDDNTLIRGLDRGINFASAGTGGPASITDASVTISRNDEIRGLGIDGILFNAGLSNATITIGGDTAAEGNGLIVGDDDGIDIENVNGGAFTIANNASITGNSLNGIEFEGAVNNGAEVAIVNNSSIISNNDDAIRFVDDLTNSSVRIEGNAIQALRDGVALAAVIEGTTDLRISDNTIHVDGSGIAQTTTSSIVDDASVVIAANSITLTGAAGTGISLNNLGSTQAIVIDANQIIGGEFGIVASQLAAGVFEGQVQIGNTTISAAHDTGLMFVNRNAASSLEVDLQGGLMVHGGASAADNGIVFDGSGLSLRANTLSDTHFTSQNGNYVELRNGGLFETGSPTLVDATDVMFDSLDATTASGYQAAELKLVHFLDDPSLGLIYPGVVNNWGGQLTYDRFTRYQDYFRTIGSLLEMNSIIIRYPAAEIVIADELDE